MNQPFSVYFLGIYCYGDTLAAKFRYKPVNKIWIFDAKVIKFNGNLKVPQIGWNNIYNLETALFTGVKEMDYVYLVHSYYVPECDGTIAVRTIGIFIYCLIPVNEGLQHFYAPATPLLLPIIL